MFCAIWRRRRNVADPPYGNGLFPPKARPVRAFSFIPNGCPSILSDMSTRISLPAMPWFETAALVALILAEALF